MKLSVEMIRSTLFKSSKPWYSVYEGEGDEGAGSGDDGDGTGGTGGSDGAGDGAGGGDGGTGAGNNGGGNKDDAPKFTQAQLNKILAEEKRKHQKQVGEQIKQLELLQKSKNLSDKEREGLSARIEELNASLMTKEQLAAKEKEKLTGEWKAEKEKLSKERDFWKEQFTESTITRTILDEAGQADAYSPSQVVDLLYGKTRLVEVLDDAGNVVPGQYAAKVKMPDTTAEGKPTTLDLTVAEALKRMKDQAEKYGNLFKSGVAGGLGGNPNQTSGRSVDPSKMSPEEYRKWRNARLGRK
jgi:hypothetical protein